MFTYKTLIIDKLKDNATIKTVFSATLTGSCAIKMENLVASASYPQILVGWGGGETTKNLDGDEGRMYITIEAKGTGSTHAYQEIGKIRSAILNVVDDTAFASTAVCYHMRKFTELEGYDEKEKVWWYRIGFDCWYKQNFNYA